MENAARLQPIVQRLLADKTAAVTNWSVQTLEGGFSGSTVQRWQGEAQTGHGVQPWSLIRKSLTPSTGSAQPTAWDYWQREALVYQSSILADLPADLVAPRCFAITEQSGEELWLWLEDMGNVEDDEWPLERYGVAARHFGQFNGAYLVGRPLPPEAWWGGADVRNRLALAEPGIHELPHLRHHPLFAELLAGDRVERILHLWAERERLLAGLARLPQTLCHRDAFRRNLMTRQSADGCEQTVVLDWAATGLGVPGEELVPLFATTLSFVAVPLTRIAELDGVLFAGYIDGLRAAGWQGDERLARFGFTALAALKAGVAGPATQIPSVARRAAALTPGAEPPRLLSPGGYPQAAARAHHLLTMGEEALQLLNSITI